jgi:pyruvate dehydrogenase E2 component (dihydrolipoamide acetyltransferase)
MAIEVRLPQFGMGMQEGTIVQWFKHEGDRVEAGELLAEIEAEKATEELIAPESGMLDQILVPEGTTVPVLELLALLDGGDASGSVGAGAPAAEVGAPADVVGRAALKPSDEPDTVIPLTGIRGRIADRMHSSLRIMAQLTLSTTADVTQLVAYRDRWPDEPRPSYTDTVVKAAALALRRHPMLNSTVEGDHIRLLPDVHIGIATDIGSGLVVPVVRHADTKSLRQIAAEAAALVERVRSGEFGVDAVSGGTFTVTSLGGQGIDAFTPIINPPEVAILGIGRIVDQPGREGDQLVWRKVMTLSLTIDHRAVDGAPGAAFLATVGALLGDPSQLASQPAR